MTMTKTELATRALSILGKVEAGQTVAAEDLTLVEGVIDPLVAQLGIQGITYVGDSNDIADEVFLPLAKRLALEIAPDYGLPAADEAALEEANRPLRRMSMSGPAYTPLKAVYF